MTLACAAGTSRRDVPTERDGDPVSFDAGAPPGDGDGQPANEHPDAASAGHHDAAITADDAGRPAEHDAATNARDAGASGSDAGAEPSDCTRVSASTLRSIGHVTSAGEYALWLRARARSSTRWSSAGNEALILDVLADARVVGQLILHQGSATFVYTMHLGELAANTELSVRVSALSAAQATQEACVGSAMLKSAAELGADGEGLANAPVFLWPREKRFDDVPLLVGYSRSLRRYEVVYSNENGGTTAGCGGGSKGIQALIARWGRAADVEAAYDLSGAKPRWLRCSGNTDTGAHALRYEAAHPLLYYGDGHNRLFESRGGYGQSCGSGGSERADGNLQGWNTANPGNDASLDDAHVVRLRPLPVSLDDVPDYLSAPEGRREGLLDTYAPWLYRLTFHELAREGKVDGSRTFDMERYVFLDVRADDVGGQGDNYCATLGLKGGFKMRLVRSDGEWLSGPQITADYFAGPVGWKRVAFALDRVYQPGEFRAVQFDAYDNDGVYFLSLGSVFMLAPEGDNGATLRSLHEGSERVDVYVDDDNGGCSNGLNHDGPAGGPAAGYPCQGGAFDLPL